MYAKFYTCEVATLLTFSLFWRISSEASSSALKMPAESGKTKE